MTQERRMKSSLTFTIHSPMAGNEVTINGTIDAGELESVLLKMGQAEVNAINEQINVAIAAKAPSLLLRAIAELYFRIECETAGRNDEGGREPPMNLAQPRTRSFLKDAVITKLTPGGLL